MSAMHEEEALGKVYDAELMRRLWPFLRPYRRWIAVSLGLIPLRAIVEALPGPLIGIGLAHLVGSDDPGKLDVVTRLATPPASIALVPWLALLLLAVTAASAVVEFVRSLVLSVMGQAALRQLRAHLFDHVQRLPISFFDRYPVGRLVTRIGNDVESLGEMFSGGIVVLAADLFLMGVFAALLFAVDWRLAAVAMAPVPVLAVAAIVFRWRMREAYRRVRTKIARLNAQLQETISGMKVVQLFARERRNLRDFVGVNREHRDAWFESIQYDALLSSAIELAVNVTIALILWYGASRVGAGGLDLGVLFVFVDYMRRFFRPLQDLSARYAVMQSSMASLERIFQLLDAKAEPAEDDSHALEDLRDEIVFDRVSFGYGDEPVLREVSLRVRAGERVALVGHTGAGKTTVLKLLARLYEPDSGRILVDGVDLREIPRTALRRRIAFVLQDVFLFTGDIASNIGLDREDLSRGEIEAAARAAHLDALLARLPRGLEHGVRERGANFSAGERQLLSFARALAQRPRILLLDEATANVDTETEALVQDAVHRLLEGKTSLVVAHRLSTIRDVDRIYVLHHGEVREEGTHEELLAARGLYWRLYQLQFAAQERAA
jgi:ATP-binding cassette subfamily B protein